MHKNKLTDKPSFLRCRHLGLCFAVLVFGLWIVARDAAAQRLDSLIHAIPRLQKAQIGPHFEQLYESLKQGYRPELHSSDSLYILEKLSVIEDKTRNLQRDTLLRLYQLHLEGQLYEVIQMKSRAIQRFKLMEKLAAQNPQCIRQHFMAHMRLGHIYWTLYNEQQALVHFEEARQLATHMQEPLRYLVAIEYDIANIYYNNKQYSEAYQSFESCVKWCQDSCFLLPRQHIDCYNGMALSLMHDDGDPKEVLYWFDEAIALAEKYQSNVWLGILNGNKGLWMHRNGRHREAIPYLLKDIQISTQNKEWGSACNAFSLLGEVYARLKDWSRSKACLDSAALYLRQKDFPGGKASSVLYHQKAMAVYYVTQNNYQEAYKWHTLADSFEDSLHAETDRGRMLRLRHAMQLLTQEKEIETLRQENDLITQNNRLQEVIILVILMAVLSGLGLAYAMYRTNQRLRKVNQSLRLHQDEIRQQNEQLVQKQEQILAINQRLTDKQQVVLAQKNEIEILNHALEAKVEERTRELQAALDSLSQQHQDLEQFSYILSHNIRSPVANIMGLLQLFEHEKENIPAHTLELLHHLRQSGQHLDTVIQDLNMIISIRKGMDLTREILSFPHIFEQVMGGLQSDLHRSGGVILQDFGVPQCYCVRAYLQSILHNLISNAIKYRSPERPLRILVSTEEADNQFLLTVTDNGLGIDLTVTDKYKIFGLYQRMHIHVEGKGLGLFLTKTQIERMGGSIDVESKPGVGTTFLVYLPKA